MHYSKQSVPLKRNLTELENELPSQFVRIHKSYIANVNNVSKITEVGNRSYEVSFYDSEQVALMSRYKAENFFKIIKEACNDWYSYHVLPGIDDGPKTLAESIKLLKMFEARKVKIIIATSHITRNSPPVSEYLKAYTELNIEKEKQNIRVDLILGSEISLNEETVMRAERKELITLGDSNYLLIELPLFGIYPVHINWIENLRVTDIDW